VKRGVVTTQVAHPNHATRTTSVKKTAMTAMRTSSASAASMPMTASQHAADSTPKVSAR